MSVIGADTSATKGSLNSVDMFTSHEGLLLEYEEPLTRKLPVPVASSRSRAGLANGHAQEEKELAYNVSAHTLWIGDRTRQLDGAHVE